MCATCLGLYLGHPQACQYKILTKEDLIKSKGPLVRDTVFIIIILLLLLLTVIELSLGGISPYTSTDKTNTKKYTYNNTKHSKYMYTCYHNTHTLQNSHIHTTTHYKTS